MARDLARRDSDLDPQLRHPVGVAGPANVHKLVCRRKSLECQLIGLAFWRASVFCCLSTGEAGETRVDLLAGSCSESLVSYKYWVDACLGDVEAG
mgnify:CR=1 FL=1